ncbi:hypothetical protein MFRU_013g01130 [Monilinia fructicola]|nr:hypothetical protein MFRU_013g01130 [Monilinia fructicola]
MSDKFMNHKLRFSAKFHNPMRGENSDRSGLNENFRQYCSKPAILRERTDSSLLKIEALDQQEREQDLDEMMHSTTFDLAPESRLPERKESKREKVKALGHSIWESLKKVR